MNKLFIFILLVILDFVSKKIVFYQLGLNSFLEIIPIMDLIHIHNYGISFGLFQDIIPPKIIVIIGLFIIAVIIYIITQTSNNFEKWGLILIIAGAFSNIIDRAMHNYVLDFIYLHYKEFYWPAFNFADIYITFGVAMILYKAIKEFKRKIKNNVSN